MSLENEIEFNRKNFSGTPMDLIRASTAAHLIELMGRGCEFEAVAFELKAQNIALGPELKERWGLSPKDIEYAVDIGIYIARSHLCLDNR